MSTHSPVTIVTGAANGIGASTARALVDRGQRVAIADVALPAAEAMAASLGNPARALAVHCDVSDEGAVRDMVARVAGHFGRIDGLVNNAVLGSPDVISRDGLIADIDVALWDRAMAVNLRGPMLCCKHVIPHLLAQGGGAIVNLSSVGGQTGGGPPAYNCSKAALQRLTSMVASQYGKQRIRCNAVAPSMTRTPGYLANVAADVERALVEGLLLPSAAEPEQIASVIVFLLSDAAGHVTGQTLNVDGGYTLRSGAEVAAHYAMAAAAPQTR